MVLSPDWFRIVYTPLKYHDALNSHVFNSVENALSLKFVDEPGPLQLQICLKRCCMM